MTDRKIKNSCSLIDEILLVNLTDLSSHHLFDRRRRKVPATPAFEIVRKFFNYTGSVNSNEEYPDVDCYALRLCRYLLEKINYYGAVQDRSGSFQETFYSRCLDDMKGDETIDEVEDPELAVIYLKQMVHLMRSAELISSEPGSGVNRKASLSDTSLFMRLFQSFWFYTNWEDIFPSDPAAASELHEARSFVRDLVLKCDEMTEIDVFSNNLSELTGFAEKNDILRISFLDFYLLTWLKHFGIMRYQNGTRYSPVAIQLTDLGRKLFSNLG